MRENHAKVLEVVALKRTRHPAAKDTRRLIRKRYSTCVCRDLTNATTAVDLTATLCLNVLASGNCFENRTKNPQSQAVSIDALEFPGVVGVGKLYLIDHGCMHVYWLYLHALGRHDRTTKPAWSGLCNCSSPSAT
jgi:hypothetical protein